MSHIGQGRKLLTLYMQRLILTKQAHFKAVRTPYRISKQYLHSGEQVITNGIKADPEGLFNPIRDVCLFDSVIPWDTMRTLCLYGRVFVMSHIGQERKFLVLYMQRFLLIKQTRFKIMRAPLGSKQTISTWWKMGRYI